MAKQTGMREESSVAHLQARYNHADSEASALDLIYQVAPRWRTDPGPVDILPFTDGVMNTLFKVTKRVPGHSELEIEKEAILLRAYGNDSDILIDREMEAITHTLLAERGLAAPLLARFQNGLLYKFLPGRVCTPDDLVKEPVWRAVAARLGEWHARLPLPYSKGDNSVQPASNIWTVLRQWVEALPSEGEHDKERNDMLKRELERSVAYLREERGNITSKLVVGHCDLLSANIILPSNFENSVDDSKHAGRSLLKGRLDFIDYEYAVPCPTAFDLANHLSEWGGFDCDYSMLPGKHVRRMFIEEYLASYAQHAELGTTVEAAVDELLADVDRYRGMPGFYWGCHALIQAQISHVEFDWVSYSELRLAEYWAWRGELDGTRIKEHKAMPFREQCWAEP